MPQAGDYSLEAFWIGGAGKPTGIHRGYRSHMAFWIGGACSPTTVPPTPPHPIQGETGSGTYRKRFTREPRIRPRRINDDAEVLELLSIIE